MNRDHFYGYLDHFVSNAIKYLNKSHANCYFTTVMIVRSNGIEFDALIPEDVDDADSVDEAVDWTAYGRRLAMEENFGDEQIEAVFVAEMDSRDHRVEVAVSGASMDGAECGAIIPLEYSDSDCLVVTGEASVDRSMATRASAKQVMAAVLRAPADGLGPQSTLQSHEPKKPV